MPTYAGTQAIAKQSAFEFSIHSAVNVSPQFLKGYHIRKIFGRYLKFVLRNIVKILEMKLHSAVHRVSDSDLAPCLREVLSSC